MANHVEPMDVDSMDSDFDKENTYHHSNVLPCTEKGYEELDVSELNMKLRYSMTPASSPMSKSYTATLDNRNLDTEDLLNRNNENNSLTRSLNSTMTKNDSAIKSLKSLPLQSLPTEQFVDGNGNSSVLRQLDCTTTGDDNVTVTVSGTNDIDDNLSLPSTSSSALHTPEATTPTKEIAKDESSPIIRGLKSVLNMFRSSQSPIPPLEGDNLTVKQEVLSPTDILINDDSKAQAVASTPIAAHRARDGNGSKRSSPYKDSIVFNDDLEKELNWKDETTIFLNHEKIPVHKLFFQNSKSNKQLETEVVGQNPNIEGNLNSAVEAMDISYNDSFKEKTIIESQDVTFAGESDSEFVDCETTFTKNESLTLETQETGGKVFLPAANTQNLDLTKDNSLTTDNTFVANLPVLYNVTGVSVTDVEYKNDLITSDYSDYSKETNEILSELEKLEEYATSKVDLTYEISNAQKNIPEKEEVMEKEHGTVATFTNVTFENDQLEQTIKSMEENERRGDKPDIETKVSQDHQLDIICVEKQVENTLSEEQNINVTQTIEFKALDSPETSIEAKQNLEAIIVSDNISRHSEDTLQIIPNKDNDTRDSETHSQDILQVNSNELNSQISQVVTFTPDLTTHQDVLQIVQHQDNGDNMLQVDVTLDPNPQIVKADQNIQATNFDLGSTETQRMVDVQMSQLATEGPMVIPKSSVQDIVPLELLNVTQEEIIPETLDISLTQKPVCRLLPDTNYHIEMMASESLDATQSIIKPISASVVKIEKPSDIPLPDEDDLDSEVVAAEVPATTPTKIVPVILPETLDVTNTLTGIDITETIHKDISDSVEDQIDNNSLNEVLNCTSPESEIVQLNEVLKTGNTDVKLDISKTFDEKPTEPLTNSKVGNETVLLDHDKIMSIDIETDLTSEALELTNNICKSDVIETIESLPGTIPETKIGDIAPKDGPSSNNIVTYCQTYENIVPNDITEIVNDSQFITNTCNDTITKDNFEQTQNKTQDIEQMDITINGSLNQTHDLSNLMNQTVVMTDENLQTSIDIIVETPKQEKLTDNPEKIEISTEVESQLMIKVVDTEDTRSDDSDLKTNNDINLGNLSETTQNDESIDYVCQSVKTDTPTTNEKSEFILENIQANNSINEPDVKVNVHQSTETIVDTSNVQNMDVEITTVEEEIIVSGNNSPYVSLMAGIETVPINTDEIFEDDQNLCVTNVNFPSSPPISSKGYNFNFDEMDDPFATKTKISMSPPLDTPNKVNEPEVEKTKSFEVPKRGIGNRRKSQPVERKKPAAMKKFNNTFDNNSSSKQPADKFDAIMEDIKNKHILNTETERETNQVKQVEIPASEEINKPFDAKPILQEVHSESERKDVWNKSEEIIENTVNKLEIPLETSVENKSSIESIATGSNNTKTTSSSELSAYYSAGTSSTDSLKSKNVFNIPEIDDINFNPFATKSKMRQSPPPDLEVENPFATRTKIRSTPETSIIVSSHSDPNITVTIDEPKLAQLVQKVDPEDKIETELMEKDTSNINNTTSSSSSKASDHLNLTTRELNTEDEDTIEGPFLEAEDIIDKMTKFDPDNVDMMQFNDVPVQGAEDNPEEGELFIDAEAYEFLLNQNTNVVADSGKESLFLKFDPLFAKRISSVGVLEALSKVQKRQSTPKKPARPSIRNEHSSIAGPSTFNDTYEGGSNVSQENNEDANITVSKPMMAVTPAVNPAVTPRNKSINPTRSNRRSITFTSPAIAVIDRLLSMSANNSFLGQDTTITQANREQTEADLALTQLRELLAEKEISVYSLRSESKELKDRLSIMESQVRLLEADGQERLKKINELNERLAEKTKINRSMAAVVEEYERTIASLIAETEQDKKRNAEERTRLINERDEQTAHLASMEVSFSDLHSKYEKSKQVIFACKANEETCKKSIKDFEENLTKMQTNYEMLKQHATSKLNHANQELEKLNRAHESEVVKLHAMIKRKDLHITSLEETLAQKTKANEELTAICDELINKVG